jgi:hypothetical protein
MSAVAREARSVIGWIEERLAEPRPRFSPLFAEEVKNRLERGLAEDEEAIRIEDHREEAKSSGA